MLKDEVGEGYMEIHLRCMFEAKRNEWESVAVEDTENEQCGYYCSVQENSLTKMKQFHERDFYLRK